MRKTIKSYFLYALQLQDDAWFILPSDSPLESKLIDDLQNDYGLLYEFIEEHPIVAVNKLLDAVSVGIEVNRYVKRYMKNYGIQKVRGGCYVDKVLDGATVALLERELHYTISDSIEDMHILNTIREEHSGTITLDEEIRALLSKIAEMKETLLSQMTAANTKLQNDYSSYVKISEWLRILKQLPPNIFEDIEWLRSQDIGATWSSEYTLRYMQVVYEHLPEVTGIFMSIVEDPDEYRIDGVRYEPITDLQSPHHVFDQVFLHGKGEGTDKGTEGTKTTALLNYFEYMAYVILNRTAEFEYDIGCYPKNFMKKHRITKAYIDKQR
jgi:hypothetical protein